MIDTVAESFLDFEIFVSRKLFNSPIWFVNASESALIDNADAKVSISLKSAFFVSCFDTLSFKLKI